MENNNFGFNPENEDSIEQSTQSTQSNQSTQSTESSQPVQSEQSSVINTQAQSVQNVPEEPAQNAQSVQNVQNVQNVQSTQNAANPQNGYVPNAQYNSFANYAQYSQSNVPPQSSNGFGAVNQPQQPQQPQKPKKKSHLKAIIAAVVAVAVIGGGSGFGGAYIAGSAIAAQSGNDNQSSYNGSTGSDGTTSQPAVTTTTPSKVTPSTDDSAIISTNIKDNTTIGNTDLDLENVVAAGTTELTAAELYEKMAPTIVDISTYTPSTTSSDDAYGFFGGSSTTPVQEEVTYTDVGSGFVFTTDGYVITNAHVIEGAAKVSVRVDDYTDSSKSYDYEAQVIGSDSATDVAVLKITRKEAFKAAPLGDSSTVKVGQDIVAIGNPIYLAKTLTKGVVSGVNRHSTSSSGYTLSSIQIDASINPGNSGGALFDMYGNVIGITNEKIIISNYIENIGFAITINEAKPIINDLLAHGYVANRPALGITSQALNEYTAYMYGFDVTSGIVVTAINADAPIASSGLAIGDIIQKINGTSVSSQTEVQAVLKDFKPGDTVTLSVVRYSNSESGRKNQVVSQNLDIQAVLTNATN